MSLGHGPTIVRDGLVLHLDAANPKSYPGTGTVWNDLSGNGNNGALTEAVYDSKNLGNIFFDGVNDFATIPVPQIAGLSVITVDAWINWRGNEGKMFFGFDTYDVYTAGGNIGYNNGGGNCIGIPKAAVTSLGCVNNFKQYTFTMRNSASLMTTNKIHIDGEEQGPMQVLVASDGNCKNFGTSMKLAIWNQGGSWIGDVSYSALKIYDRALTDEEIKQNFNATRSRYNL